MHDDDQIDVVSLPSSALNCSEGCNDPLRVDLQPNTAIMVAVMLTRNNREDEEQEVLLTAQPDECRDSNMVWYLPSGELAAGESVDEAARRVVKAEVCENADLDNIEVIALENYPSLRSNWIRFAVRACLQNSSINTQQTCWKKVEDVSQRTVDLLSFDILSLLPYTSSECSKVVRPIRPEKSALDHLFVQVGLVVDDQLLFIRDREHTKWHLPLTYADYRSGESVAFAVQRFMTQTFKVLPDVEGIAAIEHGHPVFSEEQDNALLGSRFTVLAHGRASLEEVSAAIAGKVEHKNFDFFCLEETRRLTRHTWTLDLVERLLLKRACPILSV